jgi:hypothetical protein
MPEIEKAPPRPFPLDRAAKCQNPISIALVYPVYVGDDKSDRERHMF